MDTLSSSVSTIKIPSLSRHPKSCHHERPLYHFKNHLLQQQPHFISSTTTTKSRKNSFNGSSIAPGSGLIPPPIVAKSLSSSPKAAALPLRQSSTPESHQRASTGYAVALLDVARCGNVLEAVARDVKKLSRWLHSYEHLGGVMADPFLGKNEKGEILKEVVKKGQFQKHLVKLVNLLVRKTTVDFLNQVLQEFQRLLYNELSGGGSTNAPRTQVVLVSSSAGMLKLEEDQVLGIAQRIQKLSGALKVKVRQLVNA